MIRHVNRIPLVELWNDSGPLEATRGEYLDESAVRDLFRSETSRVAVADLRAPLQWLHGTAAFDHWKTELRPHFADGTLEEWYCDSDHFYLASRWIIDDGDVIVFERYH